MDSQQGSGTNFDNAALVDLTKGSRSDNGKVLCSDCAALVDRA